MFNEKLRVFGAAALLLMIARLSPASDLQSTAAEKQAQSVLESMNASIGKQKASLRQQASVLTKTQETQNNDFFVTEALIQTPEMTADCEPLSQLAVQSLSERAAKANNLNADLVRAVMHRESAFRPCAVSSAGALGLMQLMPGTAAELDVSDPLDPEQSVFGGARLLRKLMDRYSGDLNRTLGAYNAGPASVDEANGVPRFPETVTYVAKILRDLAGPNPR